MYKKYGDKAEFFVVYIREAHPTDGRQSRENEVEKILVRQPKTIEERSDVAFQCTLRLNISIPCVLDDMKATAQKAYSAWPDRLYIVDRQGMIAFVGSRGPWGFKPAEMEKSLKKLLGELEHNR